MPLALKALRRDLRAEHYHPLRIRLRRWAGKEMEGDEIVIELEPNGGMDWPIGSGDPSVN